MAVDQNASPAEHNSYQPSAIENEIPTYRAVSAQAVVSLVLGLLSILCFTDWFFLAFAALAVILGLLADRKIKRYSDVLTGRSFAHAGVALGIAFGVSAISTNLISDFSRAQRAKEFSRTLTKVFKEGSYEDVIFYTVHPDQRKDKTAKQVFDELKKSLPHAEMMEMEYGQYKSLNNRLAQGPNQTIHVEQLETSGIDGFTPYAAPLFELHGPPSEAFPKKDEYALAFIKAKVTNGKYEWWIDQLKYPYEPATFKVPQKPVDDGHGHGEGGHGHSH